MGGMEPSQPLTAPPLLNVPSLTWKSKASGLPTSCSLRMADSPITVPLKWDCRCAGALGTIWGGGGVKGRSVRQCCEMGLCGGPGAALTRSARTAGCNPPAAGPARAAGRPACSACTQCTRSVPAAIPVPPSSACIVPPTLYRAPMQIYACWMHRCISIQAQEKPTSLPLPSIPSGTPRAPSNAPHSRVPLQGAPSCPHTSLQPLPELQH